MIILLESSLAADGLVWTGPATASPDVFCCSVDLASVLLRRVKPMASVVLRVVLPNDERLYHVLTSPIDHPGCKCCMNVLKNGTQATKMLTVRSTCVITRTLKS